MMRLSIIILNYMSFEDTKIYTKSLLEQKEVSLEIVIVDNLSPNESFKNLKKSFAGFSNVHIINSKKNGGYSFGNNYGLKYIIENNLPSLVLISNNDIEINNQHFLFKFIKKHKELPSDKAFSSPLMITNGKISSVAARKLPTIFDEIIRGSIIVRRIFKKRIDYLININAEYHKVDCLPGSFFLGDVKLFSEINLFDEGIFLYGEENILAYKINKKKYSNYLLPQLRFYHNSSQTINSFYSELSQIKMRNKSKIYFWKNYKEISSIKLFFFKLFLKYCEFEISFALSIRKIKNKTI